MTMTMRKRRGWMAGPAALALGLLAASGAAPAQEPITLRLNLEPGRSYPLSMVMEQDIEQNFQGMAQKTQQTIGTDYVYEVNRVDEEGNAHVTVRYEAIRIETTLPMGQGRIAYDSSEVESERDRQQVNPMVRPYATLVGQSFEMTLSPTGRVLELEGFDKLVEKMMQEMPAGQMGEVMKQQFRAQFNDESIKQSMQMLTAVYPQQPVSVGDSWETADEVNLGFAMRLANRHTLVGRENDLAVIRTESKITTPSNPPAMEMGPMRMTVEVGGDQSGLMMVDEASGWPVDVSLEQTLDGAMKMQNEQLPQPMTMPMKVSTKIRITSPQNDP